MEKWLEKKGFKKLWNLSSNGSFKVRVSRMISWIFVNVKETFFLEGFGYGAHGMNLLKRGGCVLGF